MSEGGAADDPLALIAAELRAEGGLLAAAVVDPAPDADRAVGERVAHGPRATVVGVDLAVAAEATREAELLHHAPERARIVRTADRDLALLAGDRLLALGLRRLAAGGWVDEVAILADVVAVVARLHAPEAWRLGAAHHGGTGHPDAAAARGARLWEAATTALATGPASPEAALLRAVRDGVVAPDLARSHADPAGS